MARFNNIASQCDGLKNYQWERKNKRVKFFTFKFLVRVGLVVMDTTYNYIIAKWSLWVKSTTLTN